LRKSLMALDSPARADPGLIEKTRKPRTLDKDRIERAQLTGKRQRVNTQSLFLSSI